jgi:hypothetical protein
MKAFTVAAILAALTATAVAKPVPVKNLNPMEDLNPAFARVDVDINSGPAGAMLEREYFEAPRPPMSGGLPCGFQSAIFDKVRLAQLCR